MECEKCYSTVCLCDLDDLREDIERIDFNLTVSLEEIRLQLSELKRHLENKTRQKVVES